VVKASIPPRRRSGCLYLVHLDFMERVARLQSHRLLLRIIVEGDSNRLLLASCGHGSILGPHFTAAAANEADTTRPLLGRGACATRGMIVYFEIRDSKRSDVDVLVVVGKCHAESQT
jgi:hypothetical protein